jgi:hypothetical protein
MHLSRDQLPSEGAAFAAAMERHFSGEDWVAALAKACIWPRERVQNCLIAGTPVPSELHDAALQVDELLTPPDIGAQDHVFAATTNDAQAAMEVDSEAGMILSPSDKPQPARSRSEHSMRMQPSDAAPGEGETLPFVGLPESMLALHVDPEDAAADAKPLKDR